MLDVALDTPAFSESKEQSVNDEQRSPVTWNESFMHILVYPLNEYRGNFVGAWFRDFFVLLERDFKETYRNYALLLVQLITTLFFAIILALIFNLNKSQAAIQNTQGLLFFVVITQSFQPLNSTKSFVDEKKIIRAERLGNCYSLGAYFFSKFVTLFTEYTILCVLYSIIVYWGTGLDPVPSKFGVFVGFLTLLSTSALALGLLISAASPTLTFANAIGMSKY